MGRNLHNAVPGEGGVLKLARLLGRKGGLSSASVYPIAAALRSRLARRLFFSRPWPVIGVFIPVVLLVAAAAMTSPAAAHAEGQNEFTMTGACAQIHDALKRLAEAEHAQALVLQLFARAAGAEAGAVAPAETAPVETGLQRLMESSSDLREILRRVRASDVAGEPSVAECLKLGYQALFTAEHISSEIQQMLIKARGYPLASAVSVRGRPPGRERLRFHPS